MAEIKNYTERHTQYFIGRINRNGDNEYLNFDTYNDLPVNIKDHLNVGKGFTEARIANLGVNFFNAQEEAKGEAREYWYYSRTDTNVINVPLNEKTDPVILDYFKNKETTEE